MAVLEGHSTGVIGVKIHEGLMQVFSYSKDAVSNSVINGKLYFKLLSHICDSCVKEMYRLTLTALVFFRFKVFAWSEEMVFLNRAARRRGRSNPSSWVLMSCLLVFRCWECLINYYDISLKKNLCLASKNNHVHM